MQNKKRSSDIASCRSYKDCSYAAIQLYKKLGFQVDTLVEGYYSSDRNAYRMYLDFDME
ncbi:hypothetical protein KY285_011630 [Solanum tuberosum]|nr:hypothetical protein KY285_011630 [Solanum tuberosum]